MKRIILVNGLIAGAVVSAMLLISMPLHEKGILNFDNGMVVGYASQVIAFSMIFIGIKTYRDQQSGGTITFGQGVKIGLLITLIAGVMYAGTWEIYMSTAGPGFIDSYTEHYMEGLREDGATAEELSDAGEKMKAYNEMYANPFVRFPITLLEILPVGILITLISAGLLRKRNILPASS